MAKYIIELDDDEEVRDKNEVSILTKYEWVTKKLTPYEEPEQEKPKRWRAEHNCVYYYVDDFGAPTYTNDSETAFEKWHYESGNYFKTKEEAEEYKESLIVYNELKAYAEPDDAVWDGDTAHWEIGYDYEACGIATPERHWRRHPELHFSSKEIAQAAIEAVGADKVKKFYIGIKED